MKTPSSLPLLLLFAALPAAADPKPGARCDTEWLEKTRATMSQPGRSVSDERLEVVSDIVKLKFGQLKTCDAATWRHLATLEPIAGEVVMDMKTHQVIGGTALRWRNPAAADFWKDATVAQHIGLVLVVSDFYAEIDAQAAAIVAAGDAVLDAAKALGYADFQVSPQTLAELGKGTTGGPIGAIKPRLATIFKEGELKAASVAPEQLGATMRKLVNDGPTLGDSVVAFRMAVLGLSEKIGTLGKSNAFFKARVGADIPGVYALTSGLPKDFILVEAKKPNALAEEKYGAALASLVGPGTLPEFKDQGMRGAALLDPIDMGLRNLIAIRSAEVDKIVATAKARLGGKSIAQFEVSARTSAEASKQPANSLAAAVVARLAESPEYQQLDSMYENKKRQPDGEAWAKTKEAQEMFAARETMLKSAGSAKVETRPDGSRVIVFEKAGKKVALTSIPPSAVEGDADTRNNVAGRIARLIVEGEAGDAKNQALFAAIGGAGQPGAPLNTNLKPGESELARAVPPATKKIRDGAAGCDNPKDLVRNDYETYAARQRAAAAEMAGGNVRSRNDVEKKRLEALAASDVECKKKKDAAAAIKQDYFDDPAIAKAAREKAAGEAEAWCAAGRTVIEDAAKTKITALAAAEAGDRDPAKLRAKADADLAAGFGAAVLASVDALRKDYTTAGSPRLKKLAEATGNSSKLTTFTALWFTLEWPQEASKNKDLEAATTDCAKALGLGDAKSSPSYRNPDNPDNVDKYCKVNEKLTKYIAGSKGSVQPLP